MSCWRVSILDTCRLAPPTFAPTPAAAGFSRYAAVNAEGTWLLEKNGPERKGKPRRYPQDQLLRSYQIPQGLRSSTSVLG